MQLLEMWVCCIRSMADYKVTDSPSQREGHPYTAGDVSRSLGPAQHLRDMKAHIGACGGRRQTGKRLNGCEVSSQITRRPRQVQEQSTKVRAFTHFRACMTSVDWDFSPPQEGLPSTDGTTPIDERDCPHVFCECSRSMRRTQGELTHSSAIYLAYEQCNEYGAGNGRLDSSCNRAR